MDHSELNETAADDPRIEAATGAADALKAALAADKLDVAELHLQELAELAGRPTDDPDVLLFRVIIMIQRGQALGALQMLNELGADRCPELRVLCLFVLRDPYWVGLAQEIAEAPPRPHVGVAMRQLLTSPPTGRRG